MALAPRPLCAKATICVQSVTKNPQRPCGELEDLASSLLSLSLLHIIPISNSYDDRECFVSIFSKHVNQAIFLPEKCALPRETSLMVAYSGSPSCRTLARMLLNAIARVPARAPGRRLDVTLVHVDEMHLSHSSEEEVCVNRTSQKPPFFF